MILMQHFFLYIRLTLNYLNLTIMRKLFSFIVTLFLTVTIAKSQPTICPGQSTTACLGQTVNLTILNCGGGGTPLLVFDSLQTISLTDDSYSGIINIGFPFTYYGNSYTQLVIASNNYVSFDLGNANGFSPWSINNPIPNASLPLDAIMAPYQDINPGAGGTIEYGTVGAAPNRTFVVRYISVPMFSCTQDEFCSTLILNEGSNVIEMYIDNKPLCTTWNGGVAIQGTHNNNGTIADVVPGRNFPTQWSVTQDAYTFTPNGSSAYTVAASTYIPSVSNNTIQWYDTYGNLVGTGVTITVTPTQDTTGYYVVYDQCAIPGGATTDTAWVYLTPPPPIITTGVDIDCNNPTGYAYTQVLGPGPYIYQWNDPMNQTGDTAFNLPPGTYTVIATDVTNGCTVTDMVTIDSSGFAVTVLTDSVACNGGNDGMAYASVSPTGINYTYLWNDPMAQTNDTAFNLPAGTYQLVVTDTAGCTDTSTIQIFEPSALNINNIIINDVTCDGKTDGTIQFNTVGGTSPYQYQWTGTSSTTSGANNLASGWYYVLITDTNNCTYTDSFFVNTPSPLNISLDTISPECGLANGQITATVTGGTPNYTYLWSNGDTNASTTTGAGTYYVTVTDSNNCTIADTATLVEVKGFNGGFTASPDFGIAPLNVSINNTSNNCVTFFWDFGNGDTTSAQYPPMVTYANDGTYTITLIACNAGNCCDTLTKTIIVETQSYLVIPNIFTPNNDGSNDVFKIDNNNIKEFSIKILNRWGKLQFESNDISNSWDGTNNGKKVSDGTYYYIISATGIDGQEFNKNGSVTLIR